MKDVLQQQVTSKDLALAVSRARSVVFGFLNRELGCRKAHNPAYSVRAFARDAGLPQSSLANVLSGRQNISLKKGRSIAKRLRMSPTDESLFLAAVDLAASRARVSKLNAYRQLQILELGLSTNNLAVSCFQAKADWYYFAVEELLRLENCQHNIGWIARRLEISRKTVERVINELTSLGSIVLKDKKWHVLQSFVSVGDGLDSLAIRQFHAGILSRAQDKLHNLDVSQRIFGAVLIPTKSENIEKINQALRNFRKEIVSLYEDTNGDGVYALGTFFVPLTTKIQTKETPNDALH